METLLNDPIGIYYIPALRGCPARGILLQAFYSERTALSKKNLIARRPKVRRVAIASESTAAGKTHLFLRTFQDLIRLVYINKFKYKTVFVFISIALKPYLHGKNSQSTVLY